MKFLVMVTLNGDSIQKYEEGYVGEPALFEEMNKYNVALMEAGVMVDGAGLRPTSKGTKVHFEGGGKVAVVDGPWSETKEAFGGYWVFECASHEECVEWVKKAPMEPGDILVIREFQEMTDFPQEVQDMFAGQAG